MKKIIFSTVLFLTAIKCLGQEPSKESMLSVNIGLAYNAQQDLVFSPLVHTDFSLLNVGINYTKEGKVFQRAGIRYGNFNPSATKPYDFTVYGVTERTYTHSFNYIDFNYLVGKKVFGSENSLIHAGGLFVADIQAVNYAYGRISSFGYTSVLGLGAFGRYQYQVGEKSILKTTLYIPFVGWLSRSPYLVNDDEFIENIASHSGIKTFIAFHGDGRFVTLDKLQSFNIDLDYSFSMDEKWSMGIGYTLKFTHSNIPRNLISYVNYLRLAASYNF